MDAQDQTETKNVERLLQELIEDILSHLIVKDLLQYRAVCKAWKTLIDNYRFQKKHFEATKDSHATLLIQRGVSTRYQHAVHIDFLSPQLGSYYESSLPDSINLGQFLNSIGSPPSNSKPLIYWKVGTVNGLVGLFYRKFLVIWNPFTKEICKIEAPPGNSLSDLLDTYRSGRISTANSISGFGYDPKNEDYKYVMIAYTEPACKATVQLYSLRNNSWKKFTLDFLYVHEGIHGGCYIDGKFYWFVTNVIREDRISIGQAIVQFDFCDETLELIPVYGVKSIYNTIIVTMRNCLELITTFGNCRNEKEWRCEVWSMGEDRSWTKMVSISLPPQVERLLGMWKDGQILFESKYDDLRNRDVLLVDPSTGLCNKLGHGSSSLEVCTYVPSLYSIKQRSDCKLLGACT